MEVDALITTLGEAYIALEAALAAVTDRVRVLDVRRTDVAATAAIADSAEWRTDASTASFPGATFVTAGSAIVYVGECVHTRAGVKPNFSRTRTLC